MNLSSKDECAFSSVFSHKVRSRLHYSYLKSLFQIASRILFYLWARDFGGAFKAPNTIAQTPNMPAPPMAYATSRPAHQYRVQNNSGPQDLPICPKSQLVSTSGNDSKRSWLTPTPVIAQFPTPFSFSSLEATQAVQSSHNRSSRYCQ